MSDVSRGDVVLVADGVYASKRRPVVVLQDDLFASTDSLTVCPLTTTAVDAPLLRLEVPANSTTGVDALSWAMVDKVTTVRRSNVGDTVGNLDARLMLELERRLIVFLGLAH